MPTKLELQAKNAELRAALRLTSQLRADLKRSQESNAKLRSDLAASTSSLTASVGEVEHAEAIAVAAEKERAASGRALLAAQADLAKVSEDLDAEKRSHIDYRADASKRLSAANLALSEAKEDLGKATSELSAARAGLGAAHAEIDDVKLNLSNVTADLRSSKSDCLKLTSDLEKEAREKLRLTDRLNTDREARAGGHSIVAELRARISLLEREALAK